MKHPTPKEFLHQHRAWNGKAVTASATVRTHISVAGLSKLRVRAVTATNGGTLAFKAVKPTADGDFPTDGSSVHTDPAIASLTVSSTEDTADIDLRGEAVIVLEYTDSGSGTTGLDVVVSGSRY